MITVPEKYKEEFDKSALIALEKGEITPSALASELGVSTLVASIMVGFLEKTGLVTEGKNDDVRVARLTLAEWDEIDRDPSRIVKEEKKEAFVPEIAKESEELVLPAFTFKKGALRVEGDTLVFGKTSVSIVDITSLVFKKGLFFGGEIMLFREGDTPLKLSVTRRERAEALDASIIIDKFIKKEYNICE